MKLSKENRLTLLMSMHQSIEVNANMTAEYIENGIKGNPVLKSALRKVIASSISDTLFELLNIIVGTSDPATEIGDWTEVMLVDLQEENEMDSMLHDDFFSAYWHWQKKRNNSDWKFGLLD